MEEPAGVWVVIDRDYYEVIIKVYPTEIRALREINGRGSGRVAFLKWGQGLDDHSED